MPPVADPKPKPTTRRLSTAEERRETVVAAAMRVFARGGMSAPTTEVAREAGISQAYVFRLFPTKEDLAVAVAGRCRERLVATFTQARDAGDAAGAKERMGRAYADLVRVDQDVLRCQLHMQAASPHHPALREAMQGTFAALHAIAAEAMEPWEVVVFFAHGMLINTMVAIGADGLDAPWAHALNCWDEPAGL